MSTGVAPADSSQRQARLGPFSILERLSTSESPGNQVVLRVAGTPGSAVDGLTGIATCYPAPAGDDARSRVGTLLQSLKDVRDPLLWPVIDAGIAGSVAYWVRPAPAGDALLGYSGDLSIRDVGAMTQSLARALDGVHAVGLSHGAIRENLILRTPDHGWTLYGLGIMGRGPAQDQFDLAHAVVNRLAGRSWSEPDLSAYPEEERAYHRGQRLREALSSYTERIANVLNKAMHPDPALRYESADAFAADFTDQIRLSGEDLVHGAFEAVSARNVDLARLMANKAALYNPASENLHVLQIQLNGGSAFGGQSAPIVGGAPGGFATTHAGPQSPVLPPPIPGMPPMASGNPVHVDGSRVVLDPATGLVLPPMQGYSTMNAPQIPAELTQGLPPEFVQLIAPQFQQQPVKKRISPLLILGLGGIGVVLLMLIAAMATIVLTGS